MTDPNELLSLLESHAGDAQLDGAKCRQLFAHCKAGNLPDEWNPLKTLSGKGITFQREISKRDKRIAELEAELSERREEALWIRNKLKLAPNAPANSLRPNRLEP